MQAAAENRALNMLASALGPVRRYFDDPEICEIYVNSDAHLWVERLGRGREDTGTKIAAADTRKLIEMVASFASSIANKERPVISAELPFYGYRFEGSLAPVSRAPSFNIRKPALRVYSLENYVESGIMTETQMQVLKTAVRARENILVAGGTGSGKTTLANALLGEIAKTGDRLLILEDTRELVCKAADFEAFRTQDNVSMADLVKSAMRRRPDRIIVGEVRDRSALDLLKAWNTGHPGGICTLHANSAYGALLRLEQLTGEATVTPQQALIGEAVKLIVYIGRKSELVNGKAVRARKVKEVCRCAGYHSGRYELAAVE